MKTIHIEPSSRCTLACPQCPRTYNLDNIPIEDCDIPSMVRACRGFDEITMCGNHGDPIYHAEFHDLLYRLREDQPHVRFNIITNGAFRSKTWWKQTAGLLESKDHVIFSIDGIPTNNHTYRINSRWDGIETGIRTLRKHTPDQLLMTWKWILFRYNENDVKQGKQIARDLGFNRFLLVQSVRYTEKEFLIPTKSLLEIWEDANV